jgi:hypothetical protein
MFKTLFCHKPDYKAKEAPEFLKESYTMGNHHRRRWSDLTRRGCHLYDLLAYFAAVCMPRDEEAHQIHLKIYRYIILSVKFT